LHLSFLEKEILKKMREGAVHWRAGANQPAQPAKAARPPRARIPSFLSLGHGRAPRMPDSVTAAAPRGRHARPAGATTSPSASGQLKRAHHFLSYSVRTISLSLALSPQLRAHRTAARHWSSQVSSALFQAHCDLSAPSSTSPSSAFASACSDEIFSLR